MSSEKGHEPWIAQTVRCLNRHGSWTGRIHIHKLLFLLGESGLAKPPFEFVLYQYGPYSYGLDSDISVMELYGQIAKDFPRPGYGPKYRVSELDSELADQLDPKPASAIERVASLVGNLDSQSLEVQATCVWVERRENIVLDDKIVDRVVFLKPKYDPSRVRRELASARQLLRELQPA